MCAALKISEQELREDISVLNVVNFGAGTYVLYAEIARGRHDRGRPRAVRRLVRASGAAAAGRGQGAGRGDRPDRRAHPGGLAGVGAREGRRRARRGSRSTRGSRSRPPVGDDAEIAAVVSRAIADRRLLSFEYYKENEDEFSTRLVEPYALINGREGWYRGELRPRPRRASATSVSTGSSRPR